MTTTTVQTDTQLASRLRLAVMRLARVLRQKAQDPITPSQLSALVSVERDGPVTLGDLAALEIVQPPTMTRIQWVAQTSLIVYTLHKGGVVLGVATGLQFLPMFVGGMWGGIIADRYDKRVTLIWTQALQAMLAAAFGALVLTHVITVWQIY